MSGYTPARGHIFLPRPTPIACKVRQLLDRTGANRACVPALDASQQRRLLEIALRVTLKWEGHPDPSCVRLHDAAPAAAQSTTTLPERAHPQVAPVERAAATAWKPNGRRGGLAAAANP